MKIIADKSGITSRITKIVMTSETAGDEMILGMILKLAEKGGVFSGEPDGIAVKIGESVAVWTPREPDDLSAEVP